MNHVEQHTKQMYDKFFSSVIIFCTSYDDETGTTSYIVRMKGNWFACYGQVSRWVDAQDEDDRDIDDEPIIDEQPSKLLIKHVAELAEHYDAVHIFVTYKKDDGICYASHGTGNFLVRYGFILHWLEYESVSTLAED
jgi:hypothetical protein